MLHIDEKFHADTPIKPSSALIIDDDKSMQYLLSRQLKKTEKISNIYTVDNGRKGIDHLLKLKSQPENFPDLILLDVNMPVADGWQFLKDYEQVPPHLRKLTTVIMMSNMLNDEYRKRATKYPFVERFLRKPADQEKIEEIIDDYLLD